ncbi:Protein of unknown function [Bacillus toyonensis]|nr:Protein of unknown function [Bacillus toyonensis]
MINMQLSLPSYYVSKNL